MPSDAITPEMVNAAEEAVYPRHERGFLMKPLVGAIDMRAALTAALAQGAVEAEPFGWVRRSEQDGNPPVYHFTRDPETAEKWQRRGESPRPLYASPPEELERVMRERDEARAEVARYWTSADMKPWVDLAEEKGLGHFGKKLKGMFSRAMAAEEQARQSWEAEAAATERADSAESQLAEARAQLAALSREGGE